MPIRRMHTPHDLNADADARALLHQAAHSMTRALYSAYAGPLYAVTRRSDMASKTITALSAGGFADAAAQDAFCAGTGCTVETIFDQSPHGNHLKAGRTPTPSQPIICSRTLTGSEHPISVLSGRQPATF